ncbi:MAG: acetylglutamate kinase, partial [Spirochaetales bacterium]|nr:acetylglutamate kinase [Spirochaetales bacterium]
ALAVALEADTLVYISDIRGVLKNGNVLPRLDEEKIVQEIQSGVIAGGMVPKVRNALEAVASGCKKVVIGGYTSGGDLTLLLEGRSGTTIEEDLD